MITNRAGLDLIKSFEGLRLKAYKCPAGVLTIGYGTTSGVKPGMTITEAQAEAFLKRDLAVFEAAVTKAIKVPVTGNEFSACVSLAYNVGSAAFSKSTLVKRLNQGDRESAQAQFALWNKAGGRVLAGLTRRRAAEAKLFGTPDAALVTTPTLEPKPDAPGLFGFLARLFRKAK